MKDNLPFTKANTILPRNLYLGMFSALLLTGCSLSTITEPFTGEREAEYVPGARRVPALNAHTPVPPASKLPPMVTRVAPPETQTAPGNPMVMDNPYDQYGTPVMQGNPEANKNSAPASDNDDYFFSSWFKADEPAPAPQEVVTKPLVTPPAIVAPARKQLIGNPYIPKSSPAAQVNTPVAEPQAINTAKDADKVTKTVTVNKTATAELAPLPVPVMDSVPASETAVDAGQTHETLLGRIGSKLDVFSSDNKPEAKSDYPLISSVPPKPDEFTAVKRDEQQNFNELKTDHGVAQQEKLSLDREVNGNNTAATTTTASEPKLPPVTVVHNEPAPAASAEKPSAFDNVMSSLSGKSVDDQIAQPLPAPTVDEGDKKDNNQPASASDTRNDSGPNFFENLFSSFGEPSNPPVASAKVEPAVPVVALDNMNVEAAAAKPAEFVNMPAADIQPPSEPLAAQSSLPSPDIIKTLPPSRYEARRTQH